MSSSSVYPIIQSATRSNMRGRSALMHPVSFNNVVPIGLKYSSSESQVWGRCLRLRLITSQRAVVLQTPRCLLDLLLIPSCLSVQDRQEDQGAGISAPRSVCAELPVCSAPCLPFPRIFENSQKNLRPARIKKKSENGRRCRKKSGIFAILQ